jgi:hypothetical protein
MPQIDSVTFISQIFWIFLIFGGFYLVSVEHVLPSFSTILKLRVKKAVADKAQILEVNTNQVAAFTNKENSMSKGFDQVQSNLINSTISSLSWKNEFLNQSLNNKFKSTNKAFVSSEIISEAKKSTLNKSFNF